MAKIYKDINVYDAAVSRFQTVFGQFDVAPLAGA